MGHTNVSAIDEMVVLSRQCSLYYLLTYLQAQRAELRDATASQRRDGALLRSLQAREASLLAQLGSASAQRDAEAAARREAEEAARLAAEAARREAEAARSELLALRSALARATTRLSGCRRCGGQR